MALSQCKFSSEIDRDQSLDFQLATSNSIYSSTTGSEVSNSIYSSTTCSEVSDSISNSIYSSTTCSEVSDSINSEVDGPGNNQAIRQFETGPRVKNVCRRAAVVLKQLATFPPALPKSNSPAEISLSALPQREKLNLFCKRIEGTLFGSIVKTDLRINNSLVHLKTGCCA